MKKNSLYSLRFCLLLIFFSLVMPVQAQDIVVGLRYGYGQNTFTRQSDAVKTPSYSTQKVGLVGEFFPYYSRLSVLSGVEYEFNKLGKSITLPLSVRILFGTTVRPFIEGGGYYTISLDKQSEDFILKNDLGAKAAAGLQINLNKHIRMDLSYTFRYGMTKALEEEILLPLNQVMIEEYKRKSGSIDLSIKYRF